MTENEWNALRNPVMKLRFLDRQLLDRKLKLFLIACCHRNWQLLTEPESQFAVEVAERDVDGFATSDELTSVSWEAERAMFRLDARAERRQVRDAELERRINAATLAEYVTLTDVLPYDSGHTQFHDLLAVDLLHDIFPNPFRPVTFASEWRTEAAVGIAAKMYDTRDFGNMPILADALQDAGCEHADVLAHCRDPHGVHVRGCWVVDIVLGKG